MNDSRLSWLPPSYFSDTQLEDTATYDVLIDDHVIANNTTDTSIQLNIKCFSQLNVTIIAYVGQYRSVANEIIQNDIGSKS